MGPRTPAAALALVLAAGAAAAHVRLQHPTNQKGLFWSKPTSIKLALDPAGSDDIGGDASESIAMRIAMAAWNEDPGSKATLVETAFTLSDVCDEWDDLNGSNVGLDHVVFFDENNCSGFFPGMSGTVAVTPILFNGNGQILDADILFNGDDHSFTTDGTGGAFDVQDVGTHELGHLLGLDHSGVVGATMYPYVDQNLVLQRSLSLDDVHGLRHIAPQGSFGRIDGEVRRLADNAPVAGAHVHVVDAIGRSAGADLTDDGGAYQIRGLDAGDYTVHVEPLDDPVSELNLGRGTIEVDFEATAGPTVTVGAGQTVSAADILVDDAVALSLGTASDPLPLEGVMGSAVAHVLTGSGLAGSSLAASDPTVAIGGVVAGATSIAFTVTTPAGAAPGHVDLIATSGAERSVLVGAIEVVPPDPTVTNVNPSLGNDIGGTAVTITGTGFRAGARVIIGEDVYEDGAIGGCTVVDDTTITLTTLASPPGTYDVVVMDETGVEGRDAAAFTVDSIPDLVTSFPAAGDAAGGTELILTGTNFQPGMDVRINGVVQTTVVLEGTTIARVTTDAGAAGTHDIEVENPAGAIDSLANSFEYVAQADPTLLGVTPGSGAPAGGKLITLTGAGFTALAYEVKFGVDPLTGLGGTPAALVTILDANTLEVTTPAMPAGRVSLLVSDPNTGQASILPDSFTFKSSGGGGGGGCYTVPVEGPGDPRDALASAAWLALFAAAILGYSRATRRRALERSRALARL